MQPVPLDGMFVYPKVSPTILPIDTHLKSTPKLTDTFETMIWCLSQTESVIAGVGVCYIKVSPARWELAVYPWAEQASV